MNETQVKSAQKSVEPAQPTGIARRRLLRAGVAAVPVVLALSGRSAMAGQGDPCAKGLSPLAWNSLAPDGSNCKMNSHTVESSGTLGNTPLYWKANTSNAAGNVGNVTFNSIFTTSSTTNKIFRILNNRVSDSGVIDSSNLNVYFCVAYCNAMTYGSAYAISVAELQSLFNTKQLVPSASTQLTDFQIKAFLAQTWGA
jgi:hypothetical protein